MDVWVSNFESCLPTLLPDYADFISQVNASDMASLDGPIDTIIGFWNTDAGTGEYVPGQLLDDGPSVLPQKWPYQGWGSSQIPLKWLQSDDDELLSEVFVTNSASCEHLTGGNVGKTHDQMAAIPEIQRQTGCSSAALSLLPWDTQEKLLNKFSSYWESDSKNFLGMSEYNHITVDEYGPLKADPTKLCPFDLPTEEKEKQCYSTQQAVWGVDFAEKLSKIKSAVDPNHLFYCFGCIQPYVESPSSLVSPPSEPGCDRQGWIFSCTFLCFFGLIDC